MTVSHRFKVGDQVIFTNDFGVCWGIKTITALDERCNKPTYHYEPTDTPWFSTDEYHLTLAEPEDFSLSPQELQLKYGFTPTEWYGCY